ncbi:MAG: leucine-rich repeat domain-containing protein [Treponema sp.]|nr:leucine-rich repeat domain-containing protein [Treponema sp.]
MKTKKIHLRVLPAGAVLLAVLLGGCPTPSSPGPETVTSLDLTAHIPAPVTGETPVTSVNDAQYTGAVVWKAGDMVFSGNFAEDTVYAAVIGLTAAEGYGFTGLGANAFSHSGAGSISSAADSGMVTITFPVTGPGSPSGTTVTSLDLTAHIPAPVTGETPVTSVSDTQYTGTIVWKAGGYVRGGKFLANTIYAAELSLTAAAGYTFQGLPADVFSHSGAASITSAADSGTVTLVFPVTGATESSFSGPFSDLAEMKAYLQSLPANTPGTPHTIALEGALESFSKNGDWLGGVFENLEAGKYVALDLSACTGTTIPAVPGPSTRENLSAKTLLLVSVSLPDGLTDIGKYAFYSCTGLPTVSLPDTLTGIGIRAFSFSGLTEISLPAGITTLGGSAFQDCAGLTTADLSGYTGATLPDYLFYNCTSLTTVILPSAVTTIGTNYGGVFYKTGLTNVDFLASTGITVLKKELFRECTELTTVDLSSTGITTIEEEVFWCCPKINDVILPASLEYIEQAAFWESGVTTMTVMAAGPPKMTPLFSQYNPYPGAGFIPARMPNLTAIYVPAGSEDAYKAAPGWKNFKDNITAISE